MLYKVQHSVENNNWKIQFHINTNTCSKFGPKQITATFMCFMTIDCSITMTIVIMTLKLIIERNDGDVDDDTLIVMVNILQSS